jgi:hypothetical protein
MVDQFGDPGLGRAAQFPLALALEVEPPAAPADLGQLGRLVLGAHVQARAPLMGAGAAALGDDLYVVGIESHLGAKCGWLNGWGTVSTWSAS